MIKYNTITFIDLKLKLKSVLLIFLISEQIEPEDLTLALREKTGVHERHGTEVRMVDFVTRRFILRPF